MTRGAGGIALVAASVVLVPVCALAGLFGSGAPDIKVIKVAFKEKDGECYHTVDGKPEGVIVHKGVSKKSHDILVWRFFNECREAHDICIKPPADSPLVACSGDPATVVVGTTFPLAAASDAEKTVKAYGVCTVNRDASNGGYTFQLREGKLGSIRCSGPSIKNHEISIDVGQ
jgi:hypothetical protein